MGSLREIMKPLRHIELCVTIGKNPISHHFEIQIPSNQFPINIQYYPQAINYQYPQTSFLYCAPNIDIPLDRVGRVHPSFSKTTPTYLLGRQ
ncbi:hypothetical protein CR513_51604, partial [Mucuna pruriens]